MTRAKPTLEAVGYAVRTNASAKFVLGKSGQRLAYAFMAQFASGLARYLRSSRA